MRQVGIISCESFDNFSTGGSAEEYDRIKVARERNNTLAHELSLSLSLDLLKSMTGYKNELVSDDQTQCTMIYSVI